MPFKSKAQQRYFYAAADRGEIPKSTVEEWQTATDKQKKKLPDKLPKESCLGKTSSVGELYKEADILRGAILKHGEYLPTSIMNTVRRIGNTITSKPYLLPIGGVALGALHGGLSPSLHRYAREEGSPNPITDSIKGGATAGAIAGGVGYGGLKLHSLANALAKK